MKDNIIEVNNFKEVPSNDKIYTIKDICNITGASATKINHIIFKLNKIGNGSFLNNTNQINQEDFEKIELTLDLLSDGKNFDEICDYFNNPSNNLIDKNTRVINNDNINELDIKVISQNISKQIQKQSDYIINTIKEEISKNIVDSFKEESKKIAQMSIDIINESNNKFKNEIVKNNDKIEKLYKDNKELKESLESINNNLEEFKKETEQIQSLQQKMLDRKEEYEKKSWFKKIFKY